MISGVEMYSSVLVYTHEVQCPSKTMEEKILSVFFHKGFFEIWVYGHIHPNES